MESKVNQIICGDALTELKKLDNESIDCIITSPPYWALRDYGTEGQVGLEKTFTEYLDKLLLIFDECKRVLKKTGTCWVNLGDSYGGSGVSDGETNAGFSNAINREKINNRPSTKLMSKSLCLIPFRFAIGKVDRGWILRNTIIWHKKNCMPSSVKDRFTVDFEYVMFFVKSNDTQYWVNEKTMAVVSKQPLGTKGIEGTDWDWKEVNGKTKKVSHWSGRDYWFEQQFEQLNNPKRTNFTSGNRTYGINKDRNDNDLGQRSKNFSFPNGRNKRCVWTINTQPFKGAHFAVFPEALAEPMIKSGCPEFVCKKCGKAREKIYKDTGRLIRMGGFGSKTADHIKVSPTSSILTKKVKEKQEVGYTDCGCNAGFEGGIVLDCFSGSGTTGLVAKKLNRNYILIDNNKEYCDMARKRIDAIML